MKAYFIFLTTILLLGGCATTPTDDAPQGDVLDCGVEQAEPGQYVAYNVEVRDCFYNAYLSCEPAKIKTIKTTIEGDPITQTLTILGQEGEKCKIKNDIDSQDNFGLKGQFENICYSLEKEDAENPRFILSDCEDDSVGFDYV
tara:strand:+ start:1329 stop:1757 length:429 start_codon:yes stop_codon:yes gene_type:complete